MRWSHRGMDWWMSFWGSLVGSLISTKGLKLACQSRKKSHKRMYSRLTLLIVAQQSSTMEFLLYEVVWEEQCNLCLHVSRLWLGWNVKLKLFTVVGIEIL